MKTIFSLGAMILAIILSSCVLKVSVVNPSPNVDVPIVGGGLFLDLDDNILNEMTIKRSGLKPMKITEWRTSLTHGFNNAFDEFQIVSSINDANYKIFIIKAEPFYEISEGAYDAWGSRVGGSIIVQIEYQARMIDSDGNIIKRSTSTVSSKRSTSSVNEVPLLAESAIESMFEKIAQDFFNE